MFFIQKTFNRFFGKDKELTNYIRRISGITPRNLFYYKQALTHRSSATNPKSNNERLELLGDSVLDTVVAEYLFKKYPYKGEGFITEMRSKIVSRKSLNAVGERLGLLDFLRINKKVLNDSSRDIGGNTFEAMIGALYLDAGFDAVKKFIVKRVLLQLLDVDDIETTQVDFKSKIYHYIQREGKKVDFVAEESNRGRRTYFTITLMIDDDAIAKGEGYTKKIAEQNASMKACELLGLVK